LGIVVSSGDKREEKNKRICPRCGGVIDWIERHRVKTGSKTYRTYILAVHLDRDAKKRRKCYLGPEEGYTHAALTHEHLGGLEGLEDVWDRNKFYLENLLESFLRCEDINVLKEVIEIVETSLGKLKTHLHTLEKLSDQGDVLISQPQQTRSLN
jgi:hypothetical protein